MDKHFFERPVCPDCGTVLDRWQVNDDAATLLGVCRSCSTWFALDGSLITPIFRPSSSSAPAESHPAAAGR